MSAFATLGALLFGLDIGYISGVENMDSFVQDVHNGTAIDSTSLGFITSIFSIGAAVAAFPAVSSTILTYCGRRWTIFCGSIVFACGVVLQVDRTRLGAAINIVQLDLWTSQ